MAVEPTRRRFSVDEYERMVETGVLAEDDRVELIHGEILEVAPSGPSHSIVVSRLAKAFIASVGSDAVVFVQDPVRLPPDLEPEPDIAVARPPDSRYLHAHPGADELLLVVEVAQTSHTYDREKVSLYARHDITEAWMVDIPGERVEVFRGPTPDGYGSRTVLGRGDRLTPLFADLTIDVEDVLP